MAISLAYTTPATGAQTQYHVVQNIQIDYVSAITTASVASYVDGATFTAGKFPVYTQSIQIAGIPDTARNPLVTVQEQLAAAVPAEGTGNLASRYLFAGGVLVDMPADSDTPAAPADTSAASPPAAQGA